MKRSMQVNYEVVLKNNNKYALDYMYTRCKMIPSCQYYYNYNKQLFANKKHPFMIVVSSASINSPQTNN